MVEDANIFRTWDEVAAVETVDLSTTRHYTDAATSSELPGDRALGYELSESLYECISMRGKI